jgi:ribosomal protein L18E
MSKNKSDLEFNPEDYKKINELKSKRKWKQIAKKLNQPELENEEEEEGKFEILY